MPQLFTLPQQIPLRTGAVLPGAKLHFSQTGTSTPQNTYQDIDLTTAHANPVIADANGVFPPIYLDASLPDYRVRLTDASDVQLFQIDDVPSGQDSGRTYRLASESPELIFEETDASANNKKWAIRVNAEALTIDLLNDAESVRTTIATFARSGVFNFAASSLQVDSAPVRATKTEAFTVEVTGMSSTVTGQIAGVVHADALCVLYLPGDTGIAGTSNSTSMTMTGIPEGFRPRPSTSIDRERTCLCFVRDNGSVTVARATIKQTGVITFETGVSGAGAFTNSGSKGIPAGWFIVFPR